MSKAIVRALQELIHAHQYAVACGESRFAWVEVGQKAGQPGAVGHRTANTLVDAGLAEGRGSDVNARRWEIRLKVFYDEE